jgi:hypothetical protein
MDKISAIKERVYHAPLVMAKFGTDGSVSIAHDYAKDCQFLLDKIESLQRDKADLIEVLEWYGTGSHASGYKSRTIIAQMKGETP